MMTVEQAAIAFRLTKRTLYTLCRTRKISAIKKDNSWNIDIDAPNEDVVSIPHLAKTLHVSRKWVWKLVNDGRISALSIGKNYRILISEFMKVISSRTLKKDLEKVPEDRHIL
jgi:excisionase family DNA binding protein